ASLLFSTFDKCTYLTGIQMFDIDIHTIARFSEIDYGQRNEHGREGRDLKIYHRAYPDFTHFLHILHTRYPQYDTAENQWCNNHLNKLDKTVTKGFQRDTYLWIKMT